MRNNANSQLSAGTTVEELMTHSVQTTTESETIRDAHSAMRLSRIRHLPVVDANNKLIGVVSDRDLHLGWARGLDSPISQVMSRHLQWASPTTSARDAAARMLHDKIGCLPVLDDNHHVVGIITETDFVKIAHQALALLEASGDSRVA